jgi:hypothetical protein
MSPETEALLRRVDLLRRDSERTRQSLEWLMKSVRRTREQVEQTMVELWEQVAFHERRIRPER